MFCLVYRFQTEHVAAISFPSCMNSEGPVGNQQSSRSTPCITIASTKLRLDTASLNILQKIFHLLAGSFNEPSRPTRVIASTMPTNGHRAILENHICLFHHYHKILTLTVLVTTVDALENFLNRTMTAQWEGMGDVGSARYEPALLPPCPTIRVLRCSNCQRSTHSISK